MSEYTQQGQQSGSTNQGAPSQPQAAQPGNFQQLQHEQGPDNSGQQYAEAGNYQPSDNPHDYSYSERGEQPRNQSGEYVRADDVDRLIAEKLAERDAQHAKETAKLRNQVPQLVVPMNAGGPGNDQHQASWNLAEQEAAARGETLDHWEVD